MPLMTVPVVLLAIPTVSFGWLAWSSAWLPTWILAGATEPETGPAALDAALGTALMATTAAAAGAGLWLLIRGRIGHWLPADGFVASGFGVDRAYEVLVVKPFGWVVGRVTAFDRTVIARAVTETGSGAQAVGSGLQRQHRGDVQRYVSAAFTSLVVVLVLVLVAVAT